MPSPQCEHGRQRSQCKDCGGSGICQHGRRRSRCKECGGDEEKMETPSRPPKRARVSRTTPPAAVATASAALPAFTPNTAGAYQPRLPSPHPPRRGPPAAFAATSLDFQVGESLEVEWNGTHYAAVVLSTTFDGHLNVKYESDQSKESGVEPSRVRRARGGIAPYCAICLADLTSSHQGPSTKVELPCRHTFHASCILASSAQWGPSCPLCKKT